MCKGERLPQYRFPCISSSALIPKFPGSDNGHAGNLFGVQGLRLSFSVGAALCAGEPAPRSLRSHKLGEVLTPEFGT